MASKHKNKEHLYGLVLEGLKKLKGGIVLKRTQRRMVAILATLNSNNLEGWYKDYQPYEAPGLPGRLPYHEIVDWIEKLDFWVHDVPLELQSKGIVGVNGDGIYDYTTVSETSGKYHDLDGHLLKAALANLEEMTKDIKALIKKHEGGDND